MKLNILSDLHQSRGTLPIPRNDADVVVLAGDIARPAEAVAWAAGFDKPVLYVPGNHEFYGGSIAGTVAELRRLCAPAGIRVLDNDAVVLSGVRFLGTTLWTDLMLFGQGEERAAAMREAQRFMRDFSRIEQFTPAASAALFADHACWLKARLAEPHDGPTVVITHHAPSRASIHPRFAGSLLNACFVSDAQALVDASGACLWIHGHTHDSFDYRINGTRVVCNPRGYARDGVNENALFDPDLVVEVA
jgi:predicted phosphodiesterase